jgi:hypothetical protein
MQRVLQHDVRGRLDARRAAAEDVDRAIDGRLGGSAITAHGDVAEAVPVEVLRHTTDADEGDKTPRCTRRTAAAADAPAVASTDWRRLGDRKVVCRLP